MAIGNRNPNAMSKADVYKITAKNSEDFSVQPSGPDYAIIVAESMHYVFGAVRLSARLAKEN